MPMRNIAEKTSENSNGAALLLGLSMLAGVLFAIATYGWMANGTSIYLTMIQNGLAWCL